MSLIPQIRFLIVASLVFVPAAILAAAQPEIAAAGLLGCLALVALAVFDALLSHRQLDGIRINLPAVLRASLGQEADLSIQITKGDRCPQQLLLGLALPDAVTADLTMAVDLTGAAEQHTFSWPLQARRQGRWRLERCYLEAASRFGLWGMRQQRALDTEVRIYPSLMRERRQLPGLFLNRGLGVHVQRQVGKGREFEQLRDYLPGDSIDDIHWKASARRGSPITKVYQIERTQQVYVVLDTSRLSGRRLDYPANGVCAQTTDGRLGSASILERFTAATLVLALAAERVGDHFGLLCFDDRIRAFLPAKSGKGHFGACRDAIYNLKTRLVSPDFSEVFTFIGSRLRKRALLVFLTSLDDPVLAESFSDTIGFTSRRHIVLVNMLKTGGIDPLFSGPPVNTLDDVYAKLSGHLVWRHIGEIGKVLHRRGIQFSLMENADLCPELIARYLAVKRRQIL